MTNEEAVEAIETMMAESAQSERSFKNGKSTRTFLWQQVLLQANLVEKMLNQQDMSVGSLLKQSSQLAQTLEPEKMKAEQRLDKLIVVWNRLTDPPRSLSLQKQQRSPTTAPSLLWRYRSNRAIKYNPFTDPQLVAAMPNSLFSLLTIFENARLIVNWSAASAWRNAESVATLHSERLELVRLLQDIQMQQREVDFQANASVRVKK